MNLLKKITVYKYSDDIEMFCNVFFHKNSHTMQQKLNISDVYR